MSTSARRAPALASTPPTHRAAILAACLLGALPFRATSSSAAEEETVALRGSIVDADSGELLPARLYVEDASGKSWFARVEAEGGSAVPFDKQRGGSVERHTTLSAHPFVVDVPPGKYRLTAVRGKEWLERTVEVEARAGVGPVRIELRRWVDMPARGWYSGETHVHRSLEELPNVVLAEDLHVAFPLTYWVTRAFEVPRAPGRNPIAGTREQGIVEPGELVRVDATHLIWPRNTEYEIFTVGGRPHTLGAVFVIGHREVLDFGVPPVAPIRAAAERQGALLELDKHNWPWSMAIVPLLDVDLFEVTNNHIWRTDFLFKDFGVPAPDWMEVERGTERGWIDYGLQNWYALLDCGFRMRPTAGTASGVHPVPLGFGRVYVRVDAELDYEKWIAGLDAGRSFVTTGPMLLATVDGHEPGATIDAGAVARRSVRVRGELLCARPPLALEVVSNGRVVARADLADTERSKVGTHRVRFDLSTELDGTSWVAVRAFTDAGDGRVRFAHTAPVWLDVAGRPLRPRREEAAFLVERVRDELARSREVLPEPAIGEYERALRLYEAILETAR